MEYILSGIAEAFVLLLKGDEEVYSAVSATLRASTAAIIISLVIGLPLGFLLGYFDFPGRRFFRSVFDALLALPTVLVGLWVYAFISNRGPLGGMNMLFTLKGVIVGEVVLALPIVIALSAQSIEELDLSVRDTLLTLGASGKRLLFDIMLEARYGMLMAAITAYGRVISEVGAATMLGGNIKWRTRTITTAMAFETNKGQFAMGIALGMILLLIAFIVNSTLSYAKRRRQTR
ncbi:ABC transporter permease [Acetomicrobium sp.]|jgi:tungstate transport system permease protein|uniref:ABC transporter permease n=1 Tax=Acetomicrobium sp. TaxID=1872099 RepID=UPI001BCDF24B|nr:ABC transporter permease [Acetomicrobium sp.]